MSEFNKRVHGYCTPRKRAS